ncbi:hypothetical protein [Pontibacillus salipaludis]|uniref:Rad50/SbcC-type AAA domain-containing protein n=1 Tax=Pontibacillus salipaludis TaxID=1697394 RepID=A0ABQ1PIS3_9BACI|nr:hypothetical protein [Pontibacillus salipaludis]GGC97905.1 hypothetical protein GCM10011389_01310 [Pontibacillus salipaludis]
MKISIIEWSYSNIRGVNDLKINLEEFEKQPYDVTLIMMPNGYGKTTTQVLLRAIFDGGAKDWSPDYVREFRPPGSEITQGEFSASMLIDEKFYIVKLILNYEKGLVTYKTVKSGQGGLEEGRKLPSSLKYAFSSEFVKRFIFDGELAKQIIGQESQEAVRTIRYLYQLNKLDEMSNRIKTIVKEKQDNMKLSQTKTEVGLGKLRRSKEDFEKCLRKLKYKRKIMSEEQTTNAKDIEDKREKITALIKSDENLNAEFERLQTDLSNVESDIKETSQHNLNILRNPYFISNKISNDLQTLSSQMKKLQLPRTMSRTFFIDLADNDSCVCGRHIGEGEKNYILENADRYLGDDQISVINAVKNAISDRVQSEDINTHFTNLLELINKRSELRTDLDRLVTNRNYSNADAVKELEDELKELEKSSDEINNSLNELTAKNKSEITNLSYENNIYLCEQALEKEKEKIAEATNTLDLVKKSERLEAYISDIQELTMEKLKEKIKLETNQKLKDLLRYEDVSVEEIKGYIKLKDKEGASEGQSLAIAYSFLGSMFDTSSYNLPFVVDSPAGSLDLSVRRQVSKIIPNLFDQLIVFITSGEREGFKEHFYKIGDQVQFLTINKDGDGTNCIESRELFDAFQSEDDEEAVETY